MAKNTITVEVDSKNPLDKKNIESTMKKLASLDFENRNLISEIINNPKALKGLSEHKDFLLSML